MTSRDNLDIRLLREGLGGPIMAKGHARSAITGRYISRAAAARHLRRRVRRQQESGDRVSVPDQRSLRDQGNRSAEPQLNGH